MSASPVRINQSFLAVREQRLIRWILPKLPAGVTSLDLTIFGLAGSCVGAIGLLACNLSNFGLVLVALGVSMNWFGDSLDGSLARFRKEERPRFGFLVDHTSDLLSQIILIVGFGLSPFLSLLAAMAILLCYMLFSAYTYIRAATHSIHQMAYIGLGATEFRILMIAWAFAGAAFGLREPIIGALSRIDIAVLTLAGMATLGLFAKAFAEAAEIWREENLEDAPVEAARQSPDKA